VPLWFIEGNAEYSRSPRRSEHDDVGARRGAAGRAAEVPDLESYKYFPYRWPVFLAYLGGTYGDDIVGALLRAAGETGNVQMSPDDDAPSVDSLVADWHRELTAAAQRYAVATGVTFHGQGAPPQQR